MKDNLLEPEAACEAFCVSRGQLERLSRQPGCPAVNRGTKSRRYLLWPETATLKWMAERNGSASKAEPSAPKPRRMTNAEAAAQSLAYAKRLKENARRASG